MSTKRFSFARPGAATQAQPVEPVTAPETATPTAPAPAEDRTVAIPPKSAPPALYTGEEDEPVDPSDIRLPRLNIIQKSSQSAWLKHGVGNLLLKGELVIPLPATFVVVGARPKIWIEKTKFGSGSVKPRFARSIDEVFQMGGTDQWRFSKENTKDGPAPSDKPWFMPSVTLVVLVQMPEGLPATDQAHFGYECEGKAYAAALLSVKSTNYEAVWVTLSTERRGLLREGFNSRLIHADIFMKAFSGGEAGVFKLKYGEPTSPALRELAHKIATGT